MDDLINNQHPSGDRTPGREGGDDSLAESNPTDPRNDEKVIVNEQPEHKKVNDPSQNTPYTNDDISYDEDTNNNR